MAKPVSEYNRNVILLITSEPGGGASSARARNKAASL